VLIAGLNPVAVDSVAATLMGFDPARLKTISEAWRVADLPLVDFVPAEVECISNVAEWNVRLEHLGCAPHYEFAAPDGWRGHIELA